MQNKSRFEGRMGLLMTIFALALVTTLAVLPTQFQWEVNSQGKGFIEQTTSHEPEFPDFDIRDSETKSGDSLIKFRQQAGKDASAIADAREEFVRAEESLRSQVPTLKIEYSKILGVPELIAPDPLKDRAVMSAPTGDRVGTLRGFIKENSSLVGMTHDQLDALNVQTDFVNKVGGIGLVILEQQINDIPVFRGELAGHFSNEGELFRVTNNLASGLDYSQLSTNFGDPANAVRIAAENVGAEVDMTLNAARSTDSKVYFGKGHYPASAWKYYFPIEPGVVRAAWYVNVWKPVTAYEMLIDAETGKVLWRTNMGKDQTQSVTYNVWANTTSPNMSLDSPAPLTPGPIDPSSGTQGTLQLRTMVSLIGNEAPNTFNNLGWITDGNNSLSGNNTHAGLDRFSPNGVDEPLFTGSSNRVFNFAANPAPGNPAPGDDPVPVGTTISPCSATPQVPVDNQKASAVQMFYVVNRLHDVLYRHGFTEQTRNFQVDNFARGGTGGDPVNSEGQDCAGTNNANMASSTTDGTLARMQMFVWTPATPDRDGTMDAEIILHEIGHGVTNRNHINGISGTQGGQMHEGNGDFQAHLLLSETSDPINGVYTTGGYSTLNLRAAFGGLANYYWGIRRFPKAVIAFTGGPGNLPHNPLTYADIDPAQHNVTNGAFAPAFTGSATAVHDGGEIWSSMLWEVRSRLVQRLGHAAGTSKMLQLWMDSMRATTSSSSMLNSRNAMLQVAQNTGTAADVTDIWAGFASRGLGFNASNPSGNTVVEDFGLPNASIVNPFTVSDAAPGGDGDGFPEPGETLALGVTVTNNTGATVNNVSVTVTGGGTANYGNVANGATVTQQISYTVPAAAPCGSIHQVSLVLSSAIATNPPVTREFRLGAPVGGAPAEFSNTAAISIPDVGSATPYPSTIAVSGLTGNKIIKARLNGLTHTFVSDLDLLLVGPGGQKYIFMSDVGGGGPGVTNATYTIHDGAAAAFPTTPPPTGEYRPGNIGANDPFAAPAPAPPYTNAAPGGTDTLASVFGSSGSAMNGNWDLYLVDDAAGDLGSIAGGWTLTFESNEYACGPGSPTPTPTPTPGPPTPTPTPGPPTPTPTPTPPPGVFLYDNGGLDPQATSWSGVAAPAGAQWSEVQHIEPDRTLSNTSAGSTVTGAFRLADNFTVPAGQSWSISQVVAYAYQTGSPPTPSPVTGATLRIWNGSPAAGGTIIFGDTTTNRLATSTDSGLFRIFNTVAPPPGSAPGTTRKIWENRLDVSPAQVLGPGTYWVDFAITGAGTKFAPTVTVHGQRGRPGDNGLQFVSPSWVPALDTGNPATAPDVPQDFPFKLVGSIVGGANGRADFDGDGRTDVSVFRGSSGSWYLNRSTAGFQVLNWGVSTDTLVPGDYDGDGTDDVAVFRPDANSANPDFYVLNSNGFIVSGVSWGFPGDVPANADYDGDGEYDFAVYRPSDGNWYVLLSSNGGNVIVNSPGTTPVPGDYDGDGNADRISYTTGTWTGTLSGGGTLNVALGQAGDIAVPGDYDGDGEVDQAVYRPSNGTWFVRQSSNSQVVSTQFGVSTDIPAPGDYDGDGKDDHAIYRNGQWWINGSTAGVSVVNFGVASDTPVVAKARP